MFWIMVFVVASLGLAILPLPLYGSIVAALFVSTASVVAVASVLIGKVSFANAFKANVMATVVVLVFNIALGGTAQALALPAFVLSLVVGLFVYAKYLDVSMPHALAVSIAATVVNALCMTLLTKATEVGTAAATRAAELPMFYVFAC